MLQETAADLRVPRSATRRASDPSLDSARSSTGRPRRPVAEGLGSRVGRCSALIIFYMVVAILATWPFVLSLKDTLTANGDPSQHLWIMNWNKSVFAPVEVAILRGPSVSKSAPRLACFLRSRFNPRCSCPSRSLRNSFDILLFNIIWMIGLITTGLGVFVLAWTVTGHRAASAVGGLLAILSGPVMLHAHTHLELAFCSALLPCYWPRG